MIRYTISSKFLHAILILTVSLTDVDIGRFVLEYIVQNSKFGKTLRDAGGILYRPGSVIYLSFRITSFTIKLKVCQLRLVSLAVLFQISNEHHHPLRTHGSPPRDMRQNPSICIIKLITLSVPYWIQTGHKFGRLI